jgi:hypothetical protein
MKGLLLMLGLGATWWILNKKNVANKLQYYPKGVRFDKGKLIFDLDIVNPSTTQLYFDNLFATIENQGLIVGRIQYVGRTYIQPQATTGVSFTIKAVWLDMGTFFAKVYKGEIKDVLVKGTINSMGAALPFEYKVPFL